MDTYPYHDTGFWASLSGAAAAAAAGVTWWYHTRKLRNVVIRDDGETKSLVFVLKAMREELSRAKTEHIELRARIAALEAHNELLRTQLIELRRK